MSEVAELNRTLERDAPALARALSDRGRALVFPRGIPFQAAEARGTAYNSTIGQLTDGHGHAMPLDLGARLVPELDQDAAWLYAPVQGPAAIREAWRRRQLRLAGDSVGPLSLPVVTHGLTHSIQLLAGLFAAPDLDVVVPTPAWENYELIFQLAGGARFRTFPFFDARERFNLEGLARTLDAVPGKALVLLNFPNNPTGYVPTLDEQRAIAVLLSERQGPILAVADDAYQGYVYDGTRESRSIYWELARVADPERMVPFKVDGATKELVFFSSRVGFLSTNVSGAAEAALENKLKCLIRGTVGCAAGPSLALIQAMLDHPDLDAQFEARRRVLAARAAVLRAELLALDSPALHPYPFHGAFFSLVGVDRDPEALRRKLITEFSTGVISFPDEGAIRLAFCSLEAEAIPELVARVVRATS